jgi:hypothetical protein
MKYEIWSIKYEVKYKIWNIKYKKLNMKYEI